MSKKIIVISTSLRQGGNSDILADEFIKGALENGNKIEKISLKDKEIKFCKGCLACQNTKKCIINDDMSEIIGKIKEADAIVFATPIYYYEMSGQMKTLLDRTNPLFADEYKFRDIYLLITAADDVETAADGAIKGLNGWIECFDKTTLKGVVKGLASTNMGDIKAHTEVLQEAYEMGRTV